MNLNDKKIVVAIENVVCEQLEASGISVDPFRLDGEKIVDVILEQLEGFVLVPKEPSMEMWSKLPRQLGRYMQMHDRYCPKTLKKYFYRFIGEIPEWLKKEVNNWDSDHAFATADLPVFIYKAMIEAVQEKGNV